MTDVDAATVEREKQALKSAFTSQRPRRDHGDHERQGVVRGVVCSDLSAARTGSSSGRSERGPMASSPL